jgi:hypothetical protein
MNHGSGPNTLNQVSVAFNVLGLHPVEDNPLARPANGEESTTIPKLSENHDD